MSRDGSGTMTIPHPNFVAGTVIVSGEVDANNTEIVNELTNSIAADGQTTPTANLKMGSFKFTGLGSGSAATDSLNLGQAQAQAFLYPTVGGTGDAVTLSPSPAITAYAAGQTFRFLAPGTNTTAVTVNVSALGTKAIEANQTALSAGALVSGELYEVVYDGSAFQLTAPSHMLPTPIKNNVTFDGTVTVNTTGTSTIVELVSTDAGAGAAPDLALYRNSASPIANDQLGTVTWYGKDSLGNKTQLARLATEYQDPSDGSENLLLKIRTTRAGTDANRLLIGTGTYTPSATGGDKGADTVNATTLYEAGTALASKYEAIDADILRADTGDTLTAGYLSDSFSGGSISSGTYTPAPATSQENFQHIENAGAFTLAPPASPCTVVLEITNHATTAGAITTSGFTAVDGDAFTTTGGDDFICYITKSNSFSHLSVKALQ